MKKARQPSTSTILIVPGLRDHVEDHWQTHLARNLAGDRKVVTVPPLRSSQPSSG